MTDSGQSKKRVNLEGTTVRSNAWAWSSLRGNPGIVVSNKFQTVCFLISEWKRFEETHTVNQEHGLVLFFHGCFHRVLKQLNGHLHWHNCTLLDIGLDHLAELGAWSILLFAEKVTGGQVLEAIVGNELRALCPFACTRTAENEYYGYVVWRPKGGGAGGGPEIGYGGHDVWLRELN